MEGQNQRNWVIWSTGSMICRVYGQLTGKSWIPGQCKIELWQKVIKERRWAVQRSHQSKDARWGDRSTDLPSPDRTSWRSITVHEGWWNRLRPRELRTLPDRWRHHQRFVTGLGRQTKHCTHLMLNLSDNWQTVVSLSHIGDIIWLQFPDVCIKMKFRSSNVKSR
jgi:hypothetical protein